MFYLAVSFFLLLKSKNAKKSPQVYGLCGALLIFIADFRVKTLLVF